MHGIRHGERETVIPIFCDFTENFEVPEIIVKTTTGGGLYSYPVMRVKLDKKGNERTIEVESPAGK